ncbi:MAG: phosphodiesterase [Actinobacteria bacterium]|nr:phosphodiesterase [Actinomycetota bacterium]
MTSPARVRSLLPTSVETVTTEVFRRAAQLRRARAFHPRGVVLEGTLRVPDDGGLEGAELFQPGRETPVLVRISRGAGLPTNLPDILGVAVRAVDAYGPGAAQDLLFASVAPVPILNRLLLPARDHGRATYSSVLSYEVGGRRVLLGALPRVPAGVDLVSGDEVVRAARAGDLSFDLVAAVTFGPWRPIAHVDLSGPVPAGEGERLRFGPWHTGGGLRPAGLLNRFRDAAYKGSWDGRTPGGS